MKPRILSTVRLSFPLASAIAALLLTAGGLATATERPNIILIFMD
jgi:hypothetical protein